MIMKLLVCVCVFTAVLSCSLSQPQLVFQGSQFRFLIDGKEWFQSGAVSVHSEGGSNPRGAWWSSTNQKANILKNISQQSLNGRDTFGTFKANWIEWQGYKDPSTPNVGVKVQTVAYSYSDVPDLFVFEMIYETGLPSTDSADSADKTLSTYPSFVIEDGGMERGWLTWAGNMAGVSKVGVWSHDPVYGDIDGGFPLVVFDKAMTQAVVMSPLNTFMSANQMTLTDNNTKQSLLTFGPMGSITEVPKGYSFKTVLVTGKSVLGAMDRYGNLMRGYYNKRDDYRQADFSINYLGYWTDNGACYYYNTSEYSNYEKVLEAVKKDADDSSLPYRYIQLDSWWYYKGSDGGVSKWTARPDVFPNGIEALVKETGWRVVAHNRWWSPETEYAKQYHFIVEEEAALPVDAKFWDYLLSSSQLQWNLMVYEQDWLDYQYPRTKALLNTLGLGEMWLQQMGDAAMRYGLTIQYCMPWTRHVLQSLSVPVVTQIRVSDDYQPDNSQWTIGDTTILAHAVGLAAFKDNFRTSTDQPDCKQYHNMREEYPVLETYAAALSAGPVGPSDQIGKANKTLIMATCMTDGRLLKPSYPSMSIDATFTQRAFGSGGPSGQLWAAYTLIGPHSWYYVLGAELQSDYTLTPHDLSPVHSIDQLIVAYQHSILTGTLTQVVQPFLKDNTLTISKCGKSDFQYWSIVTSVTSIPNGRILLGELSKILPVSETRFSNLDSGSATVHGVALESVVVTLYDIIKDEALPVLCTIGEDGTAFLFMGTSGGPMPYCS